MLLDLNLDTLPDSTIDLFCSRGAQIEEDSAGTSNSSIVNAEEGSQANVGDENSSNNDNSTASVFIFDILKQNNNNHAPTTTSSDTKETNFGLKLGLTGSSVRPHWLNLSSVELRRETDLKTLHQQEQQPPAKKSRRGPRSRSSQYRGVTFYRRTGRWESHIWDCGKQVYLGGFDTAHAAARAYDRAAIKFRGVDADINFTLSDYDEDMNQLKNLSKEEFVQTLRRQSSGFGRGSSKYRGVSLHKCDGWEARMGQYLGKKTCDNAAMQCNGSKPLASFEPRTYKTEKPANRGCGHDLDLSLRISALENCTTRIDNVNEGIDFRCNAGETHNKEKAMVENLGFWGWSGQQQQPPHASTLASKNHPMRLSLCPASTTNHLGRTMEEKGEVLSSSTRILKGVKQMLNKTSGTLVPECPNIAASSGFSTSSAIIARSLLDDSFARST